ncbi:iron ABC transporter substrate-binding protein [Salipiger pallidus]|uniref:Iron ABC transporter substrate-binding protein n=1 Tax=Salipiger pallidus TaxID=1775170 RepID=A0A8J3EFV4_9RHOB|nr:extracellular solute-binding protein [Salipiger pallidus]GGG72602.1 iron ABC transporter substrate-binding protein [Salipiger pallidus]
MTFPNAFTLLAVSATLSVSSASATLAADVNLYTSNSEDAVALVLDALNEQAPDIRVNVIGGGSGSLLRRIDAEKSAPAADLFWSSGFSTLAGFSELFSGYDTPQADNLLPSLQALDDPWTGTNTHVMVLMVNADVLDGNAPESWQDLMDPAWQDKVTMADPANSSSAYAQLYGIYQLYGEDGVRKLADVVEVQGSTSGVYKAVAQGEYPVGMTMEYAAQRYVAGGQDEISLTYPSDGTFLSPEGMALVKDGPNPEDAKRVYDILLSRDLQQQLFELTFRRPSRGDLDEAIAASGLPLMKDVSIVEIDQTAAGDERERLLDLWAEARG